MAVGDLNTAIQQVTVHGVVLGSNGKDRFVTNEDILVRIVGMVDAKCVTGTAAGEVMRLTVSDDVLTDAVAGTTATTAYAAATRWIGVAHEANATGADAVIRVWFNGMGYFA